MPASKDQHRASKSEPAEYYSDLLSRVSREKGHMPLVTALGRRRASKSLSQRAIAPEIDIQLAIWRNEGGAKPKVRP